LVRGANWLRIVLRGEISRADAQWFLRNISFLRSTIPISKRFITELPYFFSLSDTSTGTIMSFAAVLLLHRRVCHLLRVVVATNLLLGLLGRFVLSRSELLRLDAITAIR
jgi:hypothetical protein